MRSSLHVAAPGRRREVPAPADGPFRAHDLSIRRFHLTGLVPSEIAVVLNSQGLRVRTWAVSETFVRARLEAMDLKPNHSRTVFHQQGGTYRLRPRLRDPAL